MARATFATLTGTAASILCSLSARRSLVSARPDGTFAAARQIAAPSGADNTSRIHLGDLNGNGTLDVIWSQNEQVWVMELVGDASRGLLEVIDNGLGRSQMIRYTSTRSLAAMASRAGSPWSRQLATILPVVSRIEARFADVHTAAREKLVVVADPIWDHEERSFAGFGQVTTPAQRIDPRDPGHANAARPRSR